MFVTDGIEGGVLCSMGDNVIGFFEYRKKSSFYRETIMKFIWI